MQILILLLLTLAGCTSAPIVVQRAPQADAPFAFNGRVLIKQGMRRERSGIHWEHRAGDEITLLGPLGYTVAHIHRDSNGAVLDDAYGKHYAADDAESLMQTAVGWQLPLSGLRYWVVALPAADGEFSIENNSHGQVDQLRQQGWEIHYSKYASKARDALPLLIELKRDEIEVQLQIEEWEKQ